MSRTSWLTWLRIWRQHSAACSTLARSSASSVGRDRWMDGMDRQTGSVRGPGGVRGGLTSALGDAVQQQWVLGEPLHLGGDDVLQLQPPAARLALRLLVGGHGGSGGVPEGSWGGPGRFPGGCQYLYELVEAGVLALLGLELLQREGLAAAEPPRELLEPAALCPLELPGHAGTWWDMAGRGMTCHNTA